MNSNQISRFKEDFGHFMYEGYMHKIHMLMVGCLNQPELLLMISSRKVPKCIELHYLFKLKCAGYLSHLLKFSPACTCELYQHHSVS